MKPLRIFYASDTTPNTWMAGIKSNIWRNNLLLPLRDLGHEVLEFDFDLTPTFRNLDVTNPRHAAFIQQNRPHLSAQLFRQIQAAHAQRRVDLLFSYFYDPCVLPETLDQIRRLGIMTANWFCNGSYQLHLVREISPHYDFCLVPEKFRLPDYRAMGATPIYCQEAANPAIYRPYPVAREFDVTFVGQAYGDRPLLVRHLLKQGFRVHVWGHGWKNPHPKFLPTDTVAAINDIPAELRHDPLPDHDMVQMYSRSRINLGFSSCGDTHLSRRMLQVRLRDFEVPMSGGFYLVERMDELAEFFTEDREIACYQDRDELVEKVRHYLSHESQRETVASAGHERALRDHTWQRRFQMAFAEMGLDRA